MAAAAELLGRWRLVTLVGPGGVGKTLLGIAVAREVSDRFSAGVFLVDLSPVSNRDELVAAVAAAVGVRLVGERSDRAPVVAARLRRGPSLLVLDNCEHIADATARLVDRLSYALLDTEARTVLRQLAIFRGSLDRHQALAVAEDEATRDRIRETLAELVGQSIVVAEPSTAGTTYRLLGTVRAFLQAELDASRERADALQAHHDWYLAWARELPPGATVTNREQALSLQRHHADILQALQHARASEPDALADLALLAAGLAFSPPRRPA